MDTPEADVSAIQSGAIQPLPAYQEHDTTGSDIQPLVTAIHPSDTRHLPPSYDKKTPPSDNEDVIEPENDLEEPPASHVSTNDALSEVEELAKALREIVNGFFEAIRKENPDGIALFIDRKLVTANTTTEEGETPLLAAICTKNIQIVQLLLDFGADPNAFGTMNIISYLALNQDEPYHESYPNARRTPLQLAAALGHLPMVKLFHGTYHCSDATVAPDGQIALRLAARYGHREVVDYLPACRAGGFRRWQVQHEQAIRRCKKAMTGIYKFFKFFLWDLEKFFLWSCPKHLIVKPTVKACKWCWANKGRFGRWCKAQVVEAPGKLKSAAKSAWKVFKKVPEKVWRGSKRAAKETWRGSKRAAKETWRFVREDLPKLSKRFARWLVSLLFTRIPNAIVALVKWIWGGVTAAAQATLDVLLKVVSLIHTVLSAVVTFFKGLTLKDIWNGVRDVLHAAFVGFPKQIWEWLKKFGDVSYKILKGLFGTLGKIAWWVIVAVGWLLLFAVVFVPTQIFVIIVSIGESFLKAWYEILVWFSPKS